MNNLALIKLCGQRWSKERELRIPKIMRGLKPTIFKRESDRETAGGVCGKSWTGS